jgi:hypothetical protein
MAYLHHAPSTMTLHQRREVGALAMPRRRGASSGTLLVLLGIWGGIIPFIGPTFGYRMDTAASWTFTADRLWLSILPGAAALLGGLILLGAANRLSASIGSWLALAAGIWFVVGPTVSLLWDSPIGTNGVGADSGTQRFIEQIGFSYGLGALVTALAAGALARVMVRSERDAVLLEEAGAATTATRTDEPVAETPVTDRPVERRAVAEEPVTRRPVTDEPIANRPIADEPVTDRPAGTGPRGERLSWPEDQDADDPEANV